MDNVKIILFCCYKYIRVNDQNILYHIDFCYIFAELCEVSKDSFGNIEADQITNGKPSEYKCQETNISLYSHMIIGHLIIPCKLPKINRKIYRDSHQ